MSSASSSWFSELTMEDYNLFNESEMISFGFSPVDDSTTTNDQLNEMGNDLQQSPPPSEIHTSFLPVNPTNNSSNSTFTLAKQGFPNSPPSSSPSVSPREFFGNLDSPVEASHDQGNNRGGSRPPSKARDHLIAERKRRERLNQRFIALSALLPGLKRTDKSSVLEEAIKHLKQLQERVKSHEQQVKRKTKESSSVVSKDEAQISSNDHDSPNLSNEKSINGHFGKGLLIPEIEATVLEKNVLVRIHVSEKKEVGFLGKMLIEIEKLQLKVVSSSVLPFGNSAIITIAAQMDTEFSLTVKELERNLRSAFSKFI